MLKVSKMMYKDISVRRGALVGMLLSTYCETILLLTIVLQSRYFEYI